MNSRSMTNIKLVCAGLLALCGLVAYLLHATPTSTSS